MVLYAGSAWAFQGPFQPGWSYRSGTPAAMLKPPPVHPGPDGFLDPLAGTLVRDPAGGTQVSLRDTVDTAVTVTIRSQGGDETLPVVTIARDGRRLCQSPANAGATLYAVCGKVRLTITLYGPNPLPAGATSVSGGLATSGPLN